MAQRIIIDPVTRIEGHSKITIQLDDSGQVADAHFHVTEFRGFERMVEGRPMWEMPGITSRICGICPVSHLLASAKAGDVWRHRKTGKLVTVRWRVSLFRVALIHESGKQTVKQDHYLAGDYELVTSS